MQVGIHQPMYLPWVGLFDRISKCDLFIFLDNVQYSKNYFLNRNKIKTPNGSGWLTVPVLTKGNFGQLIKDIKIDNNTDWSKKHWMSIYYSYKKAPYFSSYGNFFETAYQKKWIYLIDLSEYMLTGILNFMKVQVPIKKASVLAVQGKKEDLILNICNSVGASEYLSGPDGRNYMDLNIFGENNIKVYFHDYRHPEYPQLYGKFLPQMSVIDLLFNCGSQSLSILKNETEKFSKA